MIRQEVRGGIGYFVFLIALHGDLGGSLELLADVKGRAEREARTGLYSADEGMKSGEPRLKPFHHPLLFELVETLFQERPPGSLELLSRLLLACPLKTIQSASVLQDGSCGANTRVKSRASISSPP